MQTQCTLSNLTHSLLFMWRVWSAAKYHNGIILCSPSKRVYQHTRISQSRNVSKGGTKRGPHVIEFAALVFPNVFHPHPEHVGIFAILVAQRHTVVHLIKKHDGSRIFNGKINGQLVMRQSLESNAHIENGKPLENYHLFILTKSHTRSK